MRISDLIKLYMDFVLQQMVSGFDLSSAPFASLRWASNFNSVFGVCVRHSLGIMSLQLCLKAVLESYTEKQEAVRDVF